MEQGLSFREVKDRCKEVPGTTIEPPPPWPYLLAWLAFRLTTDGRLKRTAEARSRPMSGRACDFLGHEREARRKRAYRETRGPVSGSAALGGLPEGGDE